MPTKITNPRQLFLDELRSVFHVERTLVAEVLPELRGNVQSSKLKADIEHHLDETRQQVRNLEEVFAILGETATPAPNEVLNGLGKEYHATLKMIQRSPATNDLFHAGVIARNEHVEIAAYIGLIELAKALEEDEIVNLLRDNLEQEEAALRKAEKAMTTLLKEKVSA